jgi:hypothetical protein
MRHRSSESYSGDRWTDQIQLTLYNRGWYAAKLLSAAEKFTGLQPAAVTEVVIF